MTRHSIGERAAKTLLISHSGGIRWYTLPSQQPRSSQPMMVKGWPTVYDGGPTLNRHYSAAAIL